MCLRAYYYALQKMQIVDFHVHIGSLSKKFRSNILNCFPNIQLPKGSLKWEMYARYADLSGIEKAVIFPIPSPDVDIEKENNYIVNSVSKRQDLFAGVALAGLPVSYYKSKGDAIVGCKDEFYLPVCRENDSHYHQLLAWLQETKRFLIIHPENKNKLTEIQSLANRYPNLNIVLAHSGREQLYTGQGVIEKIIPGIRNYSNVYLETSTIRDEYTIAELTNHFPLDRIIYGSDFPFDTNDHPGSDFYTWDFKSYKILTEEARKHFFYLNAKKLYIRNSDIRKCNVEDIAVLHKIIDNISEKEKSLLAFNAKRKLIFAEIQKRRHIHLIEYKGNIAGFFRESGRAQNSAFIEELYIQPEYRHMGLASKLLKYALLRYNKIGLKTHTDNVRMNNILSSLNIKPLILGKRITSWST